MATATPRRSLARPRPSLGNSIINTASSPSLGAAYASSQRPPLPNPLSSAFNSVTARKASFNQLTSGTLSTVPDGSVGYGLASTKEEGSSPFTMHPGTPASQRRESGGEVIEVGDAVDVPGGMHGTVKFLGGVRNRDGVFVGVELSREWAARGKNDGDVDGLVVPSLLSKIPVRRLTRPLLIHPIAGHGISQRQYLGQVSFFLCLVLKSVPHLLHRRTLFHRHRRRRHLEASTLVDATTMHTQQQNRLRTSSVNQWGRPGHRVQPSGLNLGPPYLDQSPH